MSCYPCLWADISRTRVLLLTSPAHALQAFAFESSVIPDDAHVTEEFPPPVEIASIPSISYDDDVKHSALPGVRGRAPGHESVTSARLLERAHWAGRGPIVAMT